MPLILQATGTYTTPGTTGATVVSTVAGVGNPLPFVAQIDLHSLPAAESVRIRATTPLGSSQSCFDQTITGTAVPSIVTVGPFLTDGSASAFTLSLEQTSGATVFAIVWKIYSL
jgi:hypothetical protein